MHACGINMCCSLSVRLGALSQEVWFRWRCVAVSFGQKETSFCTWQFNWWSFPCPHPSFNWNPSSGSQMGFMPACCSSFQSLRLACLLISMRLVSSHSPWFNSHNLTSTALPAICFHPSLFSFPHSAASHALMCWIAVCERARGGEAESGGGGRQTWGNPVSWMFVLKGSSQLGRVTLSHHVTPSLLLLLPALLQGRGLGYWPICIHTHFPEKGINYYVTWPAVG